jgi:sec-independent protein translocase protein TatA
VSVGPLQLLLIVVIILLLFGSKKIGNLGSDLGKAIRDFKKGMSGDDEKGDSDKSSASEKLKADEPEPTADAKRESEKSSQDSSGR